MNQELFVTNGYERALKFYKQVFVACTNCGKKTDDPIPVDNGHWCLECVEGDYDLA